MTCQVCDRKSCRPGKRSTLCRKLEGIIDAAVLLSMLTDPGLLREMQAAGDAAAGSVLGVLNRTPTGNRPTVTVTAGQSAI